MGSNKIDEKEYFDVSDSLTKTNLLISSKYKGRILEHKVLAIALSRLDTAQYDAEGSMVISIPIPYIKDHLGISGNSIYDNLDSVAKAMASTVIGVSNKKEKSFIYVPLVTRAAYKDGIFSIRFAPETSKDLISISSSFTKLRLSTMLSFKSAYSFRLYEILKSKCYDASNKKTDKFIITMNINELKLEMGVINASQGKIRSYLSGKDGYIDYDTAVKKASEQQYNTFSVFKRDCLDKAVREINEKTEMRIRYETIRGAGRKINELKFFVDILTTTERSDALSNIDHDSVLDEIFSLIDEPIKVSQARQIAEAAGYDIEKIRKAYIIAKTSATKINDLISFMIAAIRDDYDYPVAVEKKEKKVARNFEERTTDYDALIEDYFNSQEHENKEENPE